MRDLFIIGAIAGAVVAAIYFIFANGNDIDWGLASFAISWGLYLITGHLPVGPWRKDGGQP